MVDVDYILAAISIFSSFFIALFLTKFWIRKARRIGLVGRDMNKYKEKYVAESGGLAVIFATIFGILSYLFLKVIFLNESTHITLLFVTVLTILLACFLGFIDDILGWKKGLEQWQKPLLTIPIAIPLMVILAGNSTLAIPFIGIVDFGILYPLFFVPLAVVGAANGFNILGGLNGLEAGMGAIILSFLGVISWFEHLPWLSLISFCAVAALVGFLFFNAYPARVFPGDSLTYSIGALIAAIAIVGNMEKFAVILFIPYFIELAFNVKSRFKKECFGLPKRDGSLQPPEKITSLTHIFMKLTRSEKGTVSSLLLIEVILGLVLTIWYFI